MIRRIELPSFSIRARTTLCGDLASSEPGGSVTVGELTSGGGPVPSGKIRKFRTGLADQQLEDKLTLRRPLLVLSFCVTMAPSIDQPGMSAQEAAAINAAAVTRNYSVKPRLQYQTVSAVSGELPSPSAVQ